MHEAGWPEGLVSRDDQDDHGDSSLRTFRSRVPLLFMRARFMRPFIAGPCSSRSMRLKPPSERLHGGQAKRDAQGRALGAYMVGYGDPERMSVVYRCRTNGVTGLAGRTVDPAYGALRSTCFPKVGGSPEHSAREHASNPLISNDVFGRVTPRCAVRLGPKPTFSKGIRVHTWPRHSRRTGRSKRAGQVTDRAMEGHHRCVGCEEQRRSGGQSAIAVSIIDSKENSVQDQRPSPSGA